LPHNFAASDRQKLLSTGFGSNRNEASGDACHAAMAQLFVADACRVVLHADHWQVSTRAFISGLKALISGAENPASTASADVGPSGSSEWLLLETHTDKEQ
jgi:hypothetical protein